MTPLRYVGTGQRFAHAHWHSAHLAVYYGTSSSVAESPSAFHHAHLLGVQAILSIPLGPKEVIDKVVVIREPPSPPIYPGRIQISGDQTRTCRSSHDRSYFAGRPRRRLVAFGVLHIIRQVAARKVAYYRILLRTL